MFRVIILAHRQMLAVLLEWVWIVSYICLLAERSELLIRAEWQFWKDVESGFMYIDVGMHGFNLSDCVLVDSDGSGCVVEDCSLFQKRSESYRFFVQRLRQTFLAGFWGLFHIRVLMLDHSKKPYQAYQAVPTGQCHWQSAFTLTKRPCFARWIFWKTIDFINVILVIHSVFFIGSISIC